MFALEESDRGKLVADVAAGASSFAAEWRRGHWGRAISIDPAYALAPEQLEYQVRRGVATANNNVNVSPQDYRWDSVFGSVEDHQEERSATAKRFLSDIRNERNYLAASIELLPLHPESVDLVVSSHLLFAHARTLSLDFHIRAINEMIRVTRGEVRIFPIMGFECDASPILEEVARWFQMGKNTVSVDSVRVNYEFLRGSDHMLRIRKNQLL
jgi:hypothetical protein